MFGPVKVAVAATAAASEVPVNDQTYHGRCGVACNSVVWNKQRLQWPAFVSTEIDDNTDPPAFCGQKHMSQKCTKRKDTCSLMR